MAFSKGKQSTETVNIKHYVGVAPVKVLAVNPTMDEWNKVTGGNMQKEPEYTGVTDDGIKTARITLLVQPNPDKTIGNIDPVIPINFWFRKAAVVGSQSGKYQVIDKYGRTAWVTKEELEAKQIPQYSSGPANIDADYRRVVNGEEAFTNFLKAFLGIPELTYRDKNGNIMTHSDPSECEARLDGIMKIFDGDFKEIKEILNYQKDNYVKVWFGVKTTEDGKEYQDVYMDLFLKNNDNRHVRFATSLAKSLRYKNTYFGEQNPNGEVIIQDLREYTIEPTTFVEQDSKTPNMDPFDALPEVSDPTDPADGLPF